MKIYIKIIVAALLIGAIAGLYFGFAEKKVKVATDRGSYKVGGTLEVAIKNNFDKAICFSSCYPYLLELFDSGKWAAYSYPECGNDRVSSCVEAGAEKKFQLALDEGDIGTNRMKIPVCLDCQGQEFRADRTFYSNNFDIQK